MLNPNHPLHQKTTALALERFETNDFSRPDEFCVQLQLLSSLLRVFIPEAAEGVAKDLDELSVYFYENPEFDRKIMTEVFPNKD